MTAATIAPRKTRRPGLNYLVELMDRVDHINDAMYLVLNAQPDDDRQLVNALQILKDNLSSVIADYVDWQVARKGGTP